MAPSNGTDGRQPRPKHIKKSIMTRVRWLYAGFAFVGLMVFGMILLTQYGPNGKPLRNRTDLTCYKTETIPASRGNIYAHDGRILATDSPSYTVSLDFTLLDKDTFENNYRALADSLHIVLPQYSRAHFETRLREIWNVAQSNQRGRRNQFLFRDKINQLQLDRMARFPIFDLGQLGGGFKYAKDPDRFKPYENLASRTIGRPMKITGPVQRRDTVRALGLEAAFDDVLSGHDGRNRYVHLYKNVWVPVRDKVNVEVRNGLSIVTTIDIELQDIAETELRNQMMKHNALEGTAMIMEVETGEIRAISNLTRHGATAYDDNNHAIGMLLEPGSTFKLISLMALLEEAGYDINMPVDCTEKGRYMFQPKNRRRHYEVLDSHPVGKTTLRGVMEESSNIGFVKLIDGEYRDQPERFVDYVKSLGFDGRIDMQLLGGRKAIIKDPLREKETAWDPLSLMKMSYGYAVELTPAHTLMLYNAIANNGKMVAPRLVKAVVEYNDPEETVQEFPVEVLNEKICSDETLAIVRSTLEGVVERGTGMALKNPHYTVAGKTGTAQVNIPGVGYVDDKGGRYYLASFVGYFPVVKPKYTCIVAIKTYTAPGNRNTFYGAQLALPAFKAIADRTNTILTGEKTPLEPAEARTPVPLKGGNMEQIRSVTERLSVPANISKDEKGWASVMASGPGVEVGAVAIVPKTMPSVIGMPLNDALYLLERQGLKVEFTGIGRVTAQSIEDGKEIKEGDKVKLTLKPADEPPKTNNRRGR